MNNKLQSIGESINKEEIKVDEIIQQLNIDEIIILQSIYSNKYNELYTSTYFIQLWKNFKDAGMCQLTFRKKIEKLNNLGLIEIVKGSLLKIDPIQKIGNSVELRTNQYLIKRKFNNIR